MKEKEPDMVMYKKETTPNIVHAADEAILKMAQKGMEIYDKTLSKLAKN